MKGDFSRLTFAPQKHYKAVYAQQGRVQLDADWNEQAAIWNYQLEEALADLIGPAGISQASAGFRINQLESEEMQGKGENAAALPGACDFHISSGRYYVHGMLCENEQDCLFSTQPDYPGGTVPASPGAHLLAYLDVWARHVTSLDDPDLREIALEGIDTTTRLQTVWQVKLLPISAEHLRERQLTHENVVELPEWQALVEASEMRGSLSVRHNPDAALGNQLYRIEIHRGSGSETAPTFKWSRENGSHVFALSEVTRLEAREGLARFVVTLGEQLRDQAQLRPGDWVEFVDREAELLGLAPPLYKIIDRPDFTNRRFTLAGQPSPRIDAFISQHAGPLFIRRWDQRASELAPLADDGSQLLKEDTWLDLEQGIQVRFSSGEMYVTGDYWLLPARTLSATVAWPANEKEPAAQPPLGIRHHYAPLALLQRRDASWQVTHDLRHVFPSLATTAEQIKHIGQEIRRGEERDEEIEREIRRDEERDEEIEQEIRRDEEEDREAVLDIMLEKKREQAPGHVHVLVEECVSAEQLSLGELVAYVPSTGHRVVQARRENERLLLGVVSGAEIRDGEERLLVTIYGRARCKVSGPVAEGDLLTLSDQPGHARALSFEQRVLHRG
ncbi:MAG TPA: DUF6519 domain-containing protein, partial [Ktedonobacteraceae bacterium]|nr:DUF6519 domain-containing protein [Ktedonobacteraceae bacterium]